MKKVTYLLDFIGVPDRIRTCDPQIRNLVLYPAELRGHALPLERAFEKRQQAFTARTRAGFFWRVFSRPPFDLSAIDSVLKEDRMLGRLALLLLESLCRTALVPGLLLFIVSSASGQHRQETDRGDCHLEPGGESTVLAIAGPQTLHLADGRVPRERA